MCTRIITLILAASLLAGGCATERYVELPNGKIRMCYFEKCYQDAMAEKAAIEQREEEQRQEAELAEKVAKEEAENKAKAKADAEAAKIAAFKAKFPCEFAIAFGIAVGPESVDEYRHDLSYLARMAMIKPITCYVSGINAGSCSGFHLVKQIVRIDGPSQGQDNLVLITTSVKLTNGNNPVQLYISEDNLNCLGT